MVYMPHWPVPNNHYSKDIGLVRTNNLLRILGNPQNLLPPAIHVTGTNGKGSTIAYLTEIFQKSKYNIHRYTSPHLIDFNERIVINNKQIDDASLAFYTEKCREKYINNQGLNNSFFEITTAIAFLAFADHAANVDLLLMEVGMGGKDDATNSIQNKLITIFTSIAYDHMEYLGDSLTEIAEEKSGIIRHNVPCVIGPQSQDVMQTLMTVCHEIGAPCFAYNYHWTFDVVDGGEFFIHINEKKCQAIKKRYGKNIFGPYKASLFGVHQILNASIAVISALVLSTMPNFNQVDENTIKQGIQNAKWPARLEKIDSGKLFELLPSNRWEIYLDGAHNTSGAAMLAATFENIKHKKPLYIINGRTRDKDLFNFLNCFQKLKPKLVCCVRVKSEYNPEIPERIQIVAQELGFNAKVFDSLSASIQYCLKQEDKQKQEGGRILICGSLYLKGDVLLANKES